MPVSMAEAAAAVDQPLDVFECVVTAGPFKRDAADNLTLRQLVGLSIMVSLAPMVTPEAALRCAKDVTDGIRPDGRRTLLIGLGLQGGPSGAWLDPSGPRDPLLDAAIRGPTFTLPGDQIAHDLAHVIAMHRAAAQRPN